MRAHRSDCCPTGGRDAEGHARILKMGNAFFFGVCISLCFGQHASDASDARDLLGTADAADRRAACDATLSTSTKEVFWLHFPKCGSSFHDAVHGFPYHRSHKGGNHPTLSEVEDVSQLCATAAIFRDPRQREASAYNWIKHYYATKIRVPYSPRGCCTADWGWKTDVWEQVHTNIVRNHSLSETVGAFKGCMTKMILGHGCMSTFNITETDYRVAIERLKTFKFIGIIDDWHNSVCLFNYLMTGRKVGWSAVGWGGVGWENTLGRQ